MKTLYKIFLPVIAVFVTSCEMVVDVDLPLQDPVITLNSVLKTDDSVIVHLTKSVSTLDNAEITAITNAVVELYENGNLVSTLLHTEAGYYKSAFLPSIGKNYKITANAQGFKEASATMVIPSLVPIVSYTIQDSAYFLDGQYETSVKITIADPPGIKNYYHIDIMQEDEFSFFYHYLTSSDPAIAEKAGWSYQGLIFSDNYFDGKTYQLEVRFMSQNYYDPDFPPPPSDYYAILRSVNREYYLYFTSKDKHQVSAFNPFAEPAPVFNNIQNGFGIFAGYSSQTIKLN
jgi:hypothetical protein